MVEYIDPMRAIALSLYQKPTTDAEVASQLCFLTDLPAEETLSFLSTLTSDNKGVLVSPLDQRLSWFKRLPIDPTSFVFQPVTPHIPVRLANPASFVYVTTFRCAFNCKYCYAERRIGGHIELDLPQIDKIAQDCAESGCVGMQLSGGDPFARKDIIEVIDAFLCRGIHVQTSTKSILGRRVLERLSEIGLRQIQFSVDSLDGQYSQYMLGFQDHGKAIRDQVELASSLGIRVKTVTVLTPYNIGHLPELGEAMISAGTGKVIFTSYGRSLYRHSDELFISPEERRRAEHIVKGLQDKHPDAEVRLNARADHTELSDIEREKAFVSRARCTAGRESLVIYPNADVGFCESIPLDFFRIGNLAEQSLISLWQSDTMMELVQPPREKYLGTACFDCATFDECTRRGRCLRDSIKATGTAWAPDPRCHNVRQKRTRLT